MNQRLVNCDFINNMEVSNKARLLYFMFLMNADDLGFVGNGDKIADSLDQNEQTYDNALFQLKFADATKELLDKGYLYVFTNKHGNHTYLVRAWFTHNRYRHGLQTLFTKYRCLVELDEGEYHLKEEKGEEDKVNKVKENKVKQSKDEEEDNSNKEQESGGMSWSEIMENLDALPKGDEEETDEDNIDINDPFGFKK